MTQFNEATMLARYKELVAKRDEVYKETFPIQKKLDLLNQEIEDKRLLAAKVAEQIDAKWKETDLFETKRELAFLAKALGRPNGPLAS